MFNTEDTTKLIDPCESGFERDVYTKLMCRGYRVIPQVKTGAYRCERILVTITERELSFGQAHHVRIMEMERMIP
jgi:hypothetical protein